MNSPPSLVPLCHKQLTQKKEIWTESRAPSLVGPVRAKKEKKRHYSSRPGGHSAEARRELSDQNNGRAVGGHKKQRPGGGEREGEEEKKGKRQGLGQGDRGKKNDGSLLFLSLLTVASYRHFGVRFGRIFLFSCMGRVDGLLRRNTHDVGLEGSLGWFWHSNKRTGESR